jgi:CRP-like cAMP-binding protein
VAEVALLRSLPHFAVVPAPVLESLGRAVERMDIQPGSVIVRQGEHGDRFYAIADGEVEVTVDDKPRSILRRGQGFGEIALLRDQQRTATVTAVGPATVYALAAEPFLAALTGHAPTRRRVDAVASGLLTNDATPAPTDRVTA